MKKLVNGVLGRFDMRLVRQSYFDELTENAAYSTDGREWALLKAFDPKNQMRNFELLPDSHSQLRQDLFVLNTLDFKKSGYFVEFGATNGVDLSNTYLLETKFGWKGILAEPAKKWQKALKKNRKAEIETRCVYSTTGETLAFVEADEGELSTIAEFSGSDYHSQAREKGTSYDVKTISLKDMLDAHKAPKTIDYLSIDTEGSEYEILQAFDFGAYKFRVITVEHNFTPNRQKIYDLLTQNGYTRTFETHSQFDDWYVLKS